MSLHPMSLRQMPPRPMPARLIPATQPGRPGEDVACPVGITGARRDG